MTEQSLSDEVLQNILDRISCTQSLYASEISLSEDAKNRIKAFVKWMGLENKGTQIKLRSRSKFLFGKGENKEGEKVSNFKASNLYAEIFHDIGKSFNEETGDYEIDWTLKFDITFNEKLTTKCLKYDDNNKLTVCDNNESDPSAKYGEVLLGDSPVLYMLYIAPEDHVIKAID